MVLIQYYEQVGKVQRLLGNSGLDARTTSTGI